MMARTYPSLRPDGRARYHDARPAGRSPEPARPTTRTLRNHIETGTGLQRLPAEPLHAAVDQLKAAVHKLNRLFRDARRTEPHHERLERIRHEATVALIGARDLTNKEPREAASQWDQVDRERVLQHLRHTLAAVEALRRDPDPDAKRPNRGARL